MSRHRTERSLREQAYNTEVSPPWTDSNSSHRSVHHTVARPRSSKPVDATVSKNARSRACNRINHRGDRDQAS